MFHLALELDGSSKALYIDAIILIINVSNYLSQAANNGSKS